MAGLAPNPGDPVTPPAQTPRPLRRRLQPALITELVEKYRSGATTPSLCVEYSISKGGLLKLLRDQGVQLRRQSLSDEQIREAIALYRKGQSLATIAADLEVSYNCVRHAFVGAGIERRPRGGSKPHAYRTSRSAEAP